MTLCHFQAKALWNTRSFMTSLDTGCGEMTRNKRGRCNKSCRFQTWALAFSLVDILKSCKSGWSSGQFWIHHCYRLCRLQDFRDLITSACLPIWDIILLFFSVDVRVKNCTADVFWTSCSDRKIKITVLKTWAAALRLSAASLRTSVWFAHIK